MQRFTLLACLLVFLSLGCDQGQDINPIAQIGRSEGWKLSAISSDMEEKVDAAIAGLTDEQIDADSRSRETIVAQYEERVRTVTQIDDCDRDDLFFFVETGIMRLILDGVACTEDGDPNPLSTYNNRSYSLNREATELTIRASTGLFLDRFNVVEVTSDNLIFEGSRAIRDSLFTDLNYQIRYDLIAN